MSDNEKTDVDRERLDLEKHRLELDIKAYDTSRKLDTEKLLLERSQERTARLQAVLPVLIATFALGLSLWTARLQYQLQISQGVSSYNQTRLELFKRLTEHNKEGSEVRKIYSEVFPNDAKILEGEQKTQGPGNK